MHIKNSTNMTDIFYDSDQLRQLDFFTINQTGKVDRNSLYSFNWLKIADAIAYDQW